MYVRRLLVRVGVMLVLSGTVQADCVYNAKLKTKFQAITGDTVLLTGGFSGGILIKTYCCVYPSSKVIILKDSFF